jgi:hypothetical protein
VTFLFRAVIGVVIFITMTTRLSAQSAPHAAHDPRLGGAVAAIVSDTIHIEAVWSEQRRLRLFIWDATGDLLPLERLREIDARAIAASRESRLQLLEIEGYFEARIPTLLPPASIVVRVKASPALAEEQVAFTFATYSPDVLGLAMASPPDIPDTLAGILSAIAGDRREAKALLEAGQFFALPLTEERIRERVLAIEPYLAALPAAERVKAAAAIASQGRQ